MPPKEAESRSNGATGGLAALDDVELSDRYRRIFDSAMESAGGRGEWLGRKTSEGHRLLALAELAGPQRMDVHLLDLQEELRAIFSVLSQEPSADDAGRLPTEA